MSAEEMSMDEVLAHAARKHGCDHAIERRTPLDALLSGEEMDADEEERQIRNEAFRGLMDYFFADSAHPGDVVRRVYAVARAVRPHLVMDMTLEELAQMFGETKAAQSWRIKQVYNKKLKEAGFRGTHAGFQKTDTACRTYASVQQGNHNRRGKRKRP